MLVMQREGVGRKGINKLKVNEMPIIFVMEDTTEFQVNEGPNDSLIIKKDGRSGIIIKPEVSNIIRIK